MPYIVAVDFPDHNDLWFLCA